MNEYQPPSQHSNSSPQDIERAIARNKSYITPSVVVFLLYWLFYLPGIIVNVLYLVDAHNTQKVAGQAPSGIGCLWLLLVFFGLVPVFALFAILVLMIMGVSLAPLSHSIH